MAAAADEELFEDIKSVDFLGFAFGGVVIPPEGSPAGTLTFKNADSTQALGAHVHTRTPCPLLLWTVKCVPRSAQHGWPSQDWAPLRLLARAQRQTTRR